MLSIRKTMIAAGAAVVATALAMPAFAGQINLSGRATSIQEQISSTVTSSVTWSLQTGTIGLTESIVEIQSIIRTVSIVESFFATTANVSFELAQDGVNYTSPFDNVFTTASTVQTITVSDTGGITNAQLSVGAGNVSVASNSVLDGAALSSMTGSLSSSLASGGVLTLALVPGFALQNSNINALVLAATNAINGTIANPGLGMALDIEQVDLNEYSPHGNIATTGLVSQSVTIGATSGVTNVGIQVGAGNVQAAHTVVLTNSTGGSIFVNPS